MSNYGDHPTRYGKLSNEDLYSMYRESTFTKLSDDQKLDLLQETVNRDAAERGMVGAPQVTLSDLPASTGGQARNGVIEINKEMVLSGTQTTTYNGQTQVNKMSDANIQALNVAIHENIHCWQDQVIDETITIDDAAKTAEYQSNNFTESAVLQNGSYRMGSQYLKGTTSKFCYYLQSTERDAYKGAEEKTNSILQSLSEKFGTEKSFEAYQKGVELAGYDAVEKKANEFYQNPSFEKDLNQTLMNQFYGTKTQVDPKTEDAVKTEMVASYKEMHCEINTTNTMEEKGMGLHGPTTLENYNESLENNSEETLSEQSSNLHGLGEKEAGAQVSASENVGVDSSAGKDAGDSLDDSDGLDGSDDLDV